jgi:hypothetical protein
LEDAEAVDRGVAAHDPARRGIGLKVVASMPMAVPTEKAVLVAALMLRPTMDTLLGDYVSAPVPPPEPANMGAFARRAPT